MEKSGNGMDIGLKHTLMLGKNIKNGLLIRDAR